MNVRRYCQILLPALTLANPSITKKQNEIKTNVNFYFHASLYYRK